MIAVRAKSVCRAPLRLLPKGKDGGPTWAGVWSSLRGISFGARKRGDGETRPGAVILADVSFEIERGSIVCFPGPDMRASEGLLRIMTGALPLTSGEIEMTGSLGGLVSIGDVVQADLTALENIALERTFLPVAKDDSTFAERVIDFAELKDVEDVPVRRYSSGMALRLAVAIVLTAKPSVIVIGDVLGVADAAFRRRFADRVRELSREGVTTLIAGPVMAKAGLATRVIHFDRGRLSTGEEDKGENAKHGEASHSWQVMRSTAANRAVALEDVWVSRGKPGVAAVHMQWRIKHAQKVRPAIGLFQGKALVCRCDAPAAVDMAEPGWLRTTVLVPTAMLSAFPYMVTIVCASDLPQRSTVLTVRHAIRVTPGATMEHPGLVRPALLQPPFRWQVETLAEQAP